MSKFLSDVNAVRVENAKKLVKLLDWYRNEHTEERNKLAANGMILDLALRFNLNLDELLNGHRH